MTAAITFECPLPPCELSPNRRPHWARKAKAVKEYRESIAWMARAATVLLLDPWDAPAKARLRLEFNCGRDAFYRLTYHPLDADNALASFKAGIDGLRDASLIAGDTAAQLEILPPTINRTGKPAGIRVTVEAIDG